MSSKSVFVAITGRANAGKSSLLNAFIGEKIAMVSDKPQTTRTKITGVLTKGEMQYVFTDTPGFHKAKNKLGEHMNKAVSESVKGIDCVLFVFDCTGKINEGDTTLLESFGKRKNVILVLNKIDLIKDKSILAEKIALFIAIREFAAVVPTSTMTGSGINELISEIDKFSEESPHYFPDDTITDQPEKVLMAEMIREKVLHLMYEEIPHGIAVGIDNLEETVTTAGEDILNIDATIYCERESHKGMVIGKKGVMLKNIGQLAREELENFFRIKVNLKLWVKVKEDWRNKEGLIKNFGLSGNYTKQ